VCLSSDSSGIEAVNFDAIPNLKAIHTVNEPASEVC
jgi:hypothetical protein